MSIIQQIREKAAWLVFGLIALSLVGFLLMDAFVGRSRLFGGSSTTVGSVDGDKLDYIAYRKQIEQREDQIKAQGYQVNDMMQQNIREEIWKNFVEESILDGIYKKLGIQISDKELNDMLVGSNPATYIRRSFTDPKTKMFNADQAASVIAQLRALYKGNRKNERGYDEAKQFFEEAIPQIVKEREKEKYLSLISKSVYFPKWMIEKQNTDNSQIASISYVNTPYSTIPDSVAKVSDDEIASYVNAHKDQYTQEESRGIAYVSFSAAPTSGDSAAVWQQLINLKPEFASTNDVEQFISRNMSEVGYYDSYVLKSKIQVPHKDSIIALPKGALYGPYLDAGNYVIAKKVDEKTVPDSIKCRHILIKVADKEKGQIRDDSTAKKLIDSIANAIKGGADFNQLVLQYSEDEGSRNNKGEYNFSSTNSLVKPFYETVFYYPVGTKKVVKAESNDYIGYHYIEVLSQKNFEPAYKVAYLARKIEASAETDQNASGLANQFAGESRTQKAFDDNVDKQHLQKLFAAEIQPGDYSVQGLGTSRDFVRWIYGADLGDVSQPYTVGDKYVVAVVTEINKKGTMPVAKARAMVEPILRNQKKADQITKKIGSANNLQAVSSATGQPIQKADSISFTSPYIPNVGQEAKVVGAAFDRQLQGIPASPPIPGNGGVFVIKQESLSAKANYNADIDQARITQQRMQESIIERQAIEELKKVASIKDNRAKFF
ncbi:MAG TPA: peptidylprolyl isomerase [Puia sp.]|nr:peptidylprolyl isomerase [Puia sp.]